MRSKFFPLAMIVLLMFLQAGLALAGNPGHKSSFQGMTADYLAIQSALAADSADLVNKHAVSIQKQALELASEASWSATSVDRQIATRYPSLMPEIARAAGVLAGTKTIKEIRTAFGLLSKPMIEFRNMVPGNKPLVAYCPMAKESWLQDGDLIANPYYGSSMLRCGTILPD